MSEMIVKRKEDRAAQKASAEQEKKKACEEANVMLARLKQWAADDAEKRNSAKEAALERVRAERSAEREVARRIRELGY